LTFFLIHEGLFFEITNNDTPQLVGLLWTMVSSSQRPLPDNTQHSQQIDIHAPAGFKPTISTGESPCTYALDRAATGTGQVKGLEILFRVIFP
jgi:hypothetical protein